MRKSVARGRVFPQFFSTDRRIGRLSLKALALFPLLWTNADDQGRVVGDPEEIKYAVCPSIDLITKADIPEILSELAKNNLILCYEAPKSAVAQMIDWWGVHNKLQWAWPSEYPSPRGWQDHLRYKLNAKEVYTLNWPPPSLELPFKSVYFILDKESRAVKIGISDSPQDRLENLQAATPKKLRLVKIFRGGGVELERELHDKFASSSLGNEWFALTPEIENYLRTSPGDSPEVSGESRGDISGEEAATTPLDPPKDKENVTVTGEDTERGRGRGKSPESSGEKTPPSPTVLCSDSKIIYDELVKTFKFEWGEARSGGDVPLSEADVKLRVPTPRELAQMRDLARGLAGAGGCPLGYIRDAFREAAGQEKGKHRISYLKAILASWLDRPDLQRKRAPPR